MRKYRPNAPRIFAFAEPFFWWQSKTGEKTFRSPSFSDAKSRAVSGDGSEVLYMISGRLNYRIGEDSICFGPGDVLFFDSSVPHVPENPGPEKAVLLAVYHLNEPLF